MNKSTILAMNSHTIKRFWSNVDKSGDCWIWKKSVNSDGYGNFCAGGKVLKAHRVAYETIRPVTEGMQLDHLCRVRRCVRPDHLEEVTQAQNLSRGIYWQQGKTHCPAGHEYNESNTIITVRGWRVCRRCTRKS